MQSMYLIFLSLIKETKYKHTLQKFEKYDTAYINAIFFLFQKF